MSCVASPCIGAERFADSNIGTCFRLAIERRLVNNQELDAGYVLGELLNILEFL
jgi:hypothetical protein